MTSSSQFVDFDLNSVASEKRFKGFGVYVIRAVTNEGKPISIKRLGGVDPDGILYIGRSGFESRSPSRTIGNRLGEFLRGQHSGGKTYERARGILNANKEFSGHSLQARALNCEEAKIAETEKRLLKKYFEQFAELPPTYSSR